MFTVCPKCTLTLVVTTVDLRAGQGYVRCGRCANVFNALIALREGDPTAGADDPAQRRLQETAPQQPFQPAVGAGVADPEPEPELAPGFEAANGDEALEFDPVATDVSEIFVPVSDADAGGGSGSYEAVVLAEEPEEPAPAPAARQQTARAPAPADDWSLLDDEPLADAESVIEESPLAQVEEIVLAEETPFEEILAAEDDTQTTAAQETDPAWVEEMFAEAERVRTAEREALTPGAAEPAGGALENTAVRAARAATGAAAPTDTVIEPLLTENARHRPSWPYALGIAALALLLAGQGVHHYRQNLLLNPQVGATLRTVYGWFGVTLTPRWDLTAYTVKQLGAEAEGGEGTQLRVRLSLQNTSARVQPLPLLRLTLQDRYGNAVASRDLEPRDYLPARTTDLQLLQPDQRIDAELHVIDPGRAAIGFEIDACLRGEGGAIGCANDARRRTPG